MKLIPEIYVKYNRNLPSLGMIDLKLGVKIVSAKITSDAFHLRTLTGLAPGLFSVHACLTGHRNLDTLQHTRLMLLSDPGSGEYTGLSQHCQREKLTQAV